MTGKELKMIRIKLGWTQKHLAEVVGIAPNTLATQERSEVGIGEPVARLVMLIARGVDVEAALNTGRGRGDAASKSAKRTRSGNSKSSRRKRQRKDSVPGRRR